MITPSPQINTDPMVHRLVRKSQQLMLLKLTILIILLQIAVAIAKESTNAASELTLREGLRFEKRMFQV